MDRKVLLSMMRISKELYAVMSLCTKMPYVQCDEETFDDEILLFMDENEAKEEAKKLQEAGNPVSLFKIDNKNLLSFYSSLFAIDVNCIRFKMRYEEPVAIQLGELIRRPEDDKLPNGQPRIENPALHLTALYFMQILRSGKEKEKQEELKALNEELSAHFQKGKYLVAVQEDKQFPVLKQKDGKIYQPVFTDLQEFAKFNVEKKFQAIAVEAVKIPAIMAKEAAGVAINPLGVNLILQMKRKEA